MGGFYIYWSSILSVGDSVSLPYSQCVYKTVYTHSFEQVWSKKQRSKEISKTNFQFSHAHWAAQLMQRSS
jgi:hypothetical protein